MTNEQPKPCPFCGEIPCGGELIWCENRRCAFYKLSPLHLHNWNRRFSIEQIEAMQDAAGICNKAVDLSDGLASDPDPTALVEKQRKEKQDGNS